MMLMLLVWESDSSQRPETGAKNKDRKELVLPSQKGGNAEHSTYTEMTGADVNLEMSESFWMPRTYRVQTQMAGQMRNLEDSSGRPGYDMGEEGQTYRRGTDIGMLGKKEQAEGPVLKFERVAIWRGISTCR